MEQVTSPQNPRLKLLRRLSTRRGRLREGAFAVEGEDLVLAGLRAGWTPRFVVVDAGVPPDPELVHALGDAPAFAVPGDLLSEVAELAHPPRAVAVFSLPERASALVPGAAAVYLDGVRDPGNVGTVARTANAFGVGQVALGPGTADPFSPKASRASMGGVFSVACVQVASVAAAVPDDAQVVALAASAGPPLSAVELGEAPVFCIGNERDGLADATMERADVVARIPQRPDVDSINAAAAAAIVLYEWRRQHGWDGEPATATAIL